MCEEQTVHMNTEFISTNNMDASYCNFSNFGGREAKGKITNCRIQMNSYVSDVDKCRAVAGNSARSLSCARSSS